MTDLTGAQISSLLETLPGIAQVLRSPVADAFVGLIRAGTGQGEFNILHAEEVMHYAVRRNLIGAEESEKVLAEAREATARKASATAARTAKRAAAKKAKTAARKPVRAAKTARKPATKSKARPRPAARSKSKVKKKK